MNPTETSASETVSRDSAAESSQLRQQIANAIADHEVILFMKGTPEAPACGFSARTVAVLQSLGTPFAAIDILPDPRIRQELTALSNWPTIPQLFVRGELVGGCDIVTEMYESGELLELLGEGAGASPGGLGVGGGEAPAAPAAGFTPVENRLS